MLGSFVQSIVLKIAKFWQIWVDSSVLKHLFLWLFLELQHKPCERYLNIRDKMLKSEQ